MSEVEHPERYIEAGEVYASADVLIDEQQLDAGYDRMAAQISAQFRGLNPVMICIMTGGLYTTAELTKRLDFPFELDYLHVTRYAGDIRGGDLVWKVSPSIDLGGRHVLVIDDILDEGATLGATIDAIHAQQPASVRTAMLLQKMHDRLVAELEADFLGFEIPDRYVFGAGLDYKGYLRQFPAVYAIAEAYDA
ncbi:MAG TPA: hypoxanthine-guanine phosphoribosyltransferase [Salinisphaeraceae bacterium]|nr:hypoxanthine-guanine phosphoribosyltransferase [Salinisphaeraceae bacterium]